MNLHLQRWLLASLAALHLNSLSLAQDKPAASPTATVTAPTTTPAKPMAAATKQPPKQALNHKSSFDNYRPYSDEKAANWKAANDEVGRIGGWRAYLKEAQEPDAESGKKPTEIPSRSPSTQPSPATAIPPKPAQPANPHAGHGTK